MKKSESPALDLSALLSILDRDGTAEEPSRGPSDRLRALQTWKESLDRRDELERRWQQLQHEGNGGPLAGRPASLANPPAGGVHILEPATPESLTETFLAAGDGARHLAESRGLDQDKLTQARQVAEVGNHLPEFPYYGRVKRFLARQVARGVFYLSGVLTAHQRLFNEALVDLVTEAGTHVDHQAARIDHLAHAVHRLAAGIDEGFAAKQTEIRHLHSALKSLEGKLRQAHLEALEQERRMAESACEQAWLKLAEVETREATRGLDHRLEQLESTGNGSAPGSPSSSEGESDILRAQLAAVRRELATLQSDLGELTRRLARIEAIAGDLKPIQETHEDLDLTLKGLHQRLGWLEELPEQLESQAEARIALDLRLGGTEQRLGRLEEYLQENLKALHNAQRRHAALQERLADRLDALEPARDPAAATAE